MTKNYNDIAHKFYQSLKDTHAIPHEAYNAYFTTVSTIGEIDALSPTEKLLIFEGLESALDLYISGVRYK